MTPPSCAASASPTGVSAATSSKPRAVVSGGAGITGSRDNLHPLAEHPDFEFRQANVNERIAVEGDVRYVLHFASPASPPQYDANPIHTLKVGTLGTMNMLGLAHAKHATFLLASTSEVYGDPLVHPQPETYWGNVNPIGPRGCYDEAK